MLISPRYGIIAFVFYNETKAKDFESEQDEIYDLLLSKLAKEKNLIKRGNLKIFFDVVTYAPNYNGEAKNVFCTNDALKTYFDNYSGDNTDYYEYAMRCIQSIGSMKKVLSFESDISFILFPLKSYTLIYSDLL